MKYDDVTGAAETLLSAINLNDVSAINIPTGVVPSILGICHNLRSTPWFTAVAQAFPHCAAASLVPLVFCHYFCKKAHVANVLSHFCWCFSIKFSEHIYKKTHLQCGENTQWARGGN